MLRYALFVLRRIRVRFPLLSSNSQQTASTSVSKSSLFPVTAETYHNQPSAPRQMCSIRPIVISGPSGGGKSTILAQAIKEFPKAFAFSVSHTTRKPRAGEFEGQHYYFVEKDDMKRMISNGEFFEYAEFGGNIYGTSKKAVADVQNSGKICILDVELQGIRNFKAAHFDAKFILIRPPSIEVLEQRLRQRGTESEEAVQKRLKHAREDMEAVEKEPCLFDNVVVNEHLDKAYKDFLDAIRPELDSFTGVGNN